ncbi:hypothetical protein EVJ58_g10895 [Rhodofomes roseus]|uniref:BTB domain-containing protein n=1 Tax=Rhodofomes roseus TaxID=34475 RepID=A0A4Y9XKM8_9APHY|nr:hypothetical protein EVJ58_g10895 [Rhodofomes roseus]
MASQPPLPSGVMFFAGPDLGQRLRHNLQSQEGVLADANMSDAIVPVGSKAETVVCDKKLVVKLDTRMELAMMRSPRFWFRDGTTFIGVGQTLYRLYGGLLANQSPIFYGMYHLPSQVDGSSETCPIYLWGIETLEFEALLELVFGPVAENGEPQDLFTPTVPQLIGILKLSTMWDITRARKYAVDMLDSLPLTGNPDWSPIAKIACCLAFGVEPWLAPGLHSALQLSPIERDTPHFGYFRSAHDANRLYVLWCRIDRHRKALQWLPPAYITGASCNSVSKCTAGWKAAWQQGLGAKLVHPDNPLSDEGLLQYICKTREQTGLCFSCHFQVTFAMKENPSWRKEETIVSAIAEDIRRNYAFHPLV